MKPVRYSDFMPSGKKKPVSKAEKLKRANQLSLLTLCTPMKLGANTKAKKGVN